MIRPLRILAAAGLVAACADAPPARTVAESTSFGELTRSLSEEGGYFDTDNLISNESSYLHALTELDRLEVSGGAYLGVGPDQNFSYIAQVRPDVALIVDIRRDNVLQHLLFKALFDISPTRLEYLANLVGAELPEPEAVADPASLEVDTLVDVVDGLPARTGASLSALQSRIRDALDRTGFSFEDGDRETILQFHDAFRQDGLDLRFSSHYRNPQSYYPTLRRLIVERDLNGAQRSYLATAAAYGFVRELQARDRVIPVVGDLSGATAMANVARYLDETGLEVTALYTSNVEFYLFQQRTFSRFVENLEALPLAPGGVIIRSYFNRFRASHPRTVPGYASTQLVQPFDVFFDAVAAGTSYTGLMFR